MSRKPLAHLLALGLSFALTRPDSLHVAGLAALDGPDRDQVEKYIRAHKGQIINSILSSPRFDLASVPRTPEAGADFTTWHAARDLATLPAVVVPELATTEIGPVLIFPADTAASTREYAGLLLADACLYLETFAPNMQNQNARS